MKISKRITAVFLAALMMAQLHVSVAAATTHEISDQEPVIEFSVDRSELLRYLNINQAVVTCFDDEISSELKAKSYLYLAIDIQVYKDGELDFTAGDSENDAKNMVLNVDYDFESKCKYKIVTTFTAGSEVVSKTMSFTQ